MWKFCLSITDSVFQISVVNVDLFELPILACFLVGIVMNYCQQCRRFDIR